MKTVEKQSFWYKAFGFTTTVDELVDYCVKNQKPVTIKYNIHENYALGLDMYYQTFKIVTKSGIHSVKVLDQLGSSSGPDADKTYLQTARKFLQWGVKVTDIYNGGKPKRVTKKLVRTMEKKLKGNLEDRFYPVPHF